MKYVICVPDGCADEPFDGLDGRTPLEVADTPHLDALAARAQVGRAAVIPEGMAPGSDVGNMAILGYDPAEFHTGRAPIEAAALGLKLPPDRVAYRCNLVTVADDGTMVDFAAGHPTDAEAAEMIAALDAELGAGATANDQQWLEFHNGVQYRHILVAPAEWAEADCVPPHDLTGRPSVWPTGPAASKLQAVMDASRDILSRFDSKATQVWLWGQGFQPAMQSFHDRYGLDGGIVTAVDLVRGLGVLTDMALPTVEGANAWYDTNYEGKRDAALAGLRAGADVFVIHVEATDEAGHAGNGAEKVTALENWDRRILADLVPALDEMGEWRMLLLPDHATPLRLKTHTPDPVPYLLVGAGIDPDPASYTEAGVADRPAVPGHQLIRRLFA
jgi:2,3-bisphosphoglycerate-independent phosphoglycerate mutase